MYQEFYTTKMGGKNIKQRFSAITNNSRPTKAGIAAGITAGIMLFATGVFAAGTANGTYASNEPIRVYSDGRELDFENKPFVDNEEIYVPLRETLTACGLGNGDIVYDNGNITLTFYSAKLGDDQPIIAHINATGPDITFDMDQNPEYHFMRTPMRTTTHPCIMRDGVTYMPSGMLSRITSFHTEIPDATYTRHKNYMGLLAGLEIRQYDEDGQFTVVIEDEFNAYGEDRSKPESYYEPSEKVMIGTAAQMEAAGFSHKEVNGYYFPVDPVKRIVVDDAGRVQLVVPVENQKHERLEPSTGGATGWEATLLGLRSGGIVRVGDDPADYDLPAETTVYRNEIYNAPDGTSSQRVVGGFYIEPRLVIMENLPDEEA